MKKKQSLVLKGSLGLCACLALIFLVNCWPSRVSLPPLPSRISSIEGYASIKFVTDQGSTRSKFSFLFELPHQGRIEVINFLGKTLIQIIVVEEKAVFVLPSKKVYWQGEEEEIIYRFLGFRLNLYEMVCLLSGKWEEIVKSEAGAWTLERNEGGQITAGQRGDLRFEVEEFFSNSPVARVFFFRHPLNKGRLKILDIYFNRPIKENVYSLSFLDKYEQKEWAEIEKILADEN